MDIQKIIEEAPKDYSQDGEGAVVKAFGLAYWRERKPKLIEFGGHDGISNSNFFSFARETGSELLFVEPDEKRFKKLVRNTGLCPNIFCVNDFVTYDPPNLSRITNSLSWAPENVSAISIDIDGDDIHVLKSLELQPDLLFVEYNPTIPWDIKYENPKGLSHGSSASALVDVASKKGYFLAAVSSTNVILVRNDYKGIVVERSLIDLAGRVAFRRLAFSYSGELLSIDSVGRFYRDEVFKMPWGGLVPQPLPPVARGYETKRALKLLFSLYSIVVFPWALGDAIRKLMATKGASE